jgi:tetratricopeptide (TPR) repeat protein
MEAYERAIESGDPELASAAWYNLGNALYRGQQLQQSLEAYKQALRMNPSDPDAKHNLERVLEQMQQQDQQQQQGGDDQQSDEQQPEDQEGQGQQPQDQQPQDQPGQPGQDEGEDPAEQDPEPAQGDEPPEDPSDEQDPQPGQPPESPEDGQGEGAPQPQPGEMTREEAERLLDAIDEDPDEVDRQHAAARGRQPRKPW